MAYLHRLSMPVEGDDQRGGGVPAPLDTRVIALDSSCSARVVTPRRSFGDTALQVRDDVA
jgi:hypothetical protein